MNSDDDQRSTDGSDNGSDLEDFLVKSEDEEDDVQMESEDETTEAQTLLDEFPYDRSLLQESSSSGVRRSRRTRKSVQRYQDPDYMKLMMDDVDPNDVADVSGNENGDESDGEYCAEVESESDDDVSDADE